MLRFRNYVIVSFLQNRPTQDPWIPGAEEPTVLCGKDLKAGGTWMGYNIENRKNSPYTPINSIGFPLEARMKEKEGEI